MRKWGTRQDLGLIPRLVAATADDARDMDARTRKAYELATLQCWNPQDPTATQRLSMTAADSPMPPRTDPPIVQIDWKTTGDSRFQGRQDAAALDAATRLTDPKARTAAIAEVAKRVTAHAGDAAYLATFWKSAAPDAARVARLLQQANPPGPKLLDKDDAATLSAFATSLAAATKLKDKAGKPVLGKEIFECPDLWSVGMLLKYGPHGSAWDSKILADITRKMLDARAEGRIKVPDPRLVPKDTLDRARVYREFQQVLAEFDPVIPTLDRAAENGKAARHVLGNPETGLKYAKMLLNNDWHTPGIDPNAYLTGSSRSAPGLKVPLPRIEQIDLSAHPARFLDAAVSGPTGASNEAKETAWSVVNIVKANAEFFKKSSEVELSKGVVRSLSRITWLYAIDLAGSAAHGIESAAVQSGESANSPWKPIVKSFELEMLLRRVLSEPKEFGRLKGSLDGRMSLAVAATVLNPSGRQWFKEMGNFYGMIERAELEKGFDEAKLADERAERYQTAIDLISGGLGALSFSNPFGRGVAAQIVTALSTPLLKEKLETGNALDALVKNEEKFRDKVLYVEVPVVTGLIQAGVLKPPKDASWIKDGMVSPNAELVDWVNRHGGTVYGDRTLSQWIQDAQTSMRLWG